MNAQELASAATGKLMTNGWDVVCAVSVDQINQLFFQQYVQDVPGNQRSFTAISSDGNYIVSATVGPVEIAFSNSSSLLFTMNVIAAYVLCVESAADGCALAIPSNLNTIYGTVPVAQITTGIESNIGRVVADLSAATVGVLIPSATSALNGAVSSALTLYFQSTGLKFILGTLSTGPSTGPQPTAFTFALQQGTAGDSALVLLIKTTGTDGTPGPLSFYPLPDGSNAAVYISNRVLFRDCLQPFLEGRGATVDLTSASAGGLQVAVSQAVSFKGPIAETTFDSTHAACTSNTSYTCIPISVPAQGLTLSANNGLNATWKGRWTTPVTRYDPSGADDSRILETDGFSASMSATLSPSVSGDTVSLTGPVGVTGMPLGWNSFVQQALIGNPTIDTYALTHLLQPDSASISLQAGTIPCDMILTGNVDLPLTITPPQVTLAAGGTQTFKTSVPVNWSAAVGLSPDGTYTAPATITVPQAIVLHATDSSNQNNTAGVLVILVPSTSQLILTPSDAAIAFGQSINIAATDANRRPLGDVTLSLQNPQAGIIGPAGTGLWTFQSLATTPMTTTITATSPSHGNASMQLQIGMDAVTISGGGTVQGPQPMTLTATSAQNPGSALFTWITFPPDLVAAGLGSLSVSGDQRQTATYTPPVRPGISATITIIAYHIDVWDPTGTTGFGKTTITLPGW